jgi:ribosomal protein S18 acetylase RimI-like enzyme
VTTEFRKAVLPREIGSLIRFDKKVFPSDHFARADWMIYESYWMIVDSRKVGCCALERHADFDGEPLPGSLYISTTGILPKYQGMGWGQLLKCWQISYARFHGFRRIVTNTRKRNTAMQALNQKFGFRVIGVIPRYYRDPADATVVMELSVSASADSRRQGL